MRVEDDSDAVEDTSAPTLFCPASPTIGCPELNEHGLASTVPIVTHDRDPCPRVESDPPPDMLLDAGCRSVIIGHSERRQHFG